MVPRLFGGQQDDLVGRELQVDHVPRLHRLAGAQPDAGVVADAHRRLLLAAEILDHFDTAADIAAAWRDLPATADVVGTDRHHHVGPDPHVFTRARANPKAIAGAFGEALRYGFDPDLEEIPETHEIGDEDIVRPVVDLLRRAGLHQDAVAKHDDAVRQ